MPFVDIKLYPRDEETQIRLAEAVNKTFMDVLGCPPEAMTISVKNIEPEKWEEDVVKPLIEPNMDDVKILDGEKKY